MNLFYQDNLLVISISIIVIIFIYLFFKRIKSLILGFFNLVKWIKPSFEDANGQASSRKLTAFAIVITYISCRICFTHEVNDSYYLLIALIVDALFTLLLFGIVTFQQIIFLKDTLKNETFLKEIKKEENNNTNSK